jgi:AcrR family transcriptional regulator
VAKTKQGGDDRESVLVRLPPGRHGLSREFVIRNQTDRIMAAMIATVAKQGYHEASIAEIVEAARVSRRTFYMRFSSKEECFLATFDEIADFMRSAARDAADESDPWPEQVRAKLASQLEIYAANPDLARYTLIAPGRAGEGIAERYQQAAINSLEEFGVGMPASVEVPSRAVQLSLIGGMATLIINRVAAGEGETLPDLLPDLIEFVLAPFIGHEEAMRVARGSGA